MPTYDFRDKYYEVIEGKQFLLHGETFGHNLVKVSLLQLIGLHAKTNRLGVVATSLETHFPGGNIFYPDFIFISAAKAEAALKDPNEPFCGVPDMVAEIFSKSTMKRDVGIKKDVYERNGVKEYWLIDPWREAIDVYLLRGDKYELGGHYENWSEHDLEEREELPEEERPPVEMEIPVDVLDGFKVKMRNIFGWYFE